MRLGINPPSKTPPPFFCQAPPPRLKLANFPSPSFLGNSTPIYWFSINPLSKKSDFSVHPHSI